MVILSKNNSVNDTQVVEDNNVGEPADFEKAISATGFGLYNYFLVLATIPVAWAGFFDLTTTAFILASAECELELTFFRKGALASIVYVGMIVSPCLWGFITDRVQRKPLILIGLLTDALCNILTSLVDSYYIMLLLKLLTGTIVSGPLAHLGPYLSEFQAPQHRATFTKWSGLVFGVGLVVPAVLAFIITPLPWSIVLFDHQYSAWKIYLLLCSLPSIVGFVTMSFLPESPKRLMEYGHLPRAYTLLSSMYAINHRVSADNYPIKVLKSPENSIDGIQLVKSNPKKNKETWKNVKTLFSRPYLRPFLTISFLQFGSFFGFNTMRLGVPHMFIIINDFDYSQWDPRRGNPTMCDYLALNDKHPVSFNTTYNTNSSCIGWHIISSVYMNSSIIGASAVGLSFLVGLFYTTRLRKRIVITLAYLIAIFGCFGANWGQSVPLMLTLSATIIVMSRITGNIVIAANADVIPTPLRATAVDVLTNVGHVGSVVGNLIFSVLLEINCLSAFMALGGLLIVCLIVSFTILGSKSEKPIAVLA